MIVILSFRSAYSARWDDSDNEACEADFRIEVVTTDEKAAQWITGRIQEHPKASYFHLVATNFKEIAAFDQRSYTSQGEDSICAGGYFEDDATVEAAHEYLTDRVRTMVEKALGKESSAYTRKIEQEARDRREAAEKARREKEHAEWLAKAGEREAEAVKLRAKQEAEERAELARLQKKYST
jgi:hypothetical protein